MQKTSHLRICQPKTNFKSTLGKASEQQARRAGNCPEERFPQNNALVGFFARGSLVKFPSPGCKNSGSLRRRKHRDVILKEKYRAGRSREGHLKAEEGPKASGMTQE